MDMIRSIPIDLDDGEYSLMDRGDMKAIVYEIEGNDIVSEMQRQEQIPSRGVGVVGTCSSQNSSASGSTASKSKRSKATTSPAWEYFTIEYDQDKDGKSKEWQNVNFAAIG